VVMLPYEAAGRKSVSPMRDDFPGPQAHLRRRSGPAACRCRCRCPGRWRGSRRAVAQDAHFARRVGVDVRPSTIGPCRALA
jgi:hypothetical protein